MTDLDSIFTLLPAFKTKPQACISKRLHFCVWGLLSAGQWLIFSQATFNVSHILIFKRKKRRENVPKISAQKKFIWRNTFLIFLWSLPIFFLLGTSNESFCYDANFANWQPIEWTQMCVRISKNSWYAQNSWSENIHKITWNELIYLALKAKPSKLRAQCCITFCIMNEWMNERTSERTNERMNEPNEPTNERPNQPDEWMNERVSEWVNEWLNNILHEVLSDNECQL